MKRFATFLSLTLALAASGCGDSKTKTTPPADESFLPVAVGNRWVYREKAISGPAPAATSTKEITGTEQLNGRQTFVMKSTSDQSQTEHSFHWVVSGEDVLRVRQTDSIAGVKQEYHDYEPGFLRISGSLVNVGDELSEELTRKSYDASGTLVVSKTVTYLWRVEAVDVPLSVQAGSFNCLRLNREKAPGNFKRYWYAKGVGKVYEEGLVNTEELLEYTVAE